MLGLLRRTPVAIALSILAGLLQALSSGWPSPDLGDGVAHIDHPGLAEFAWILQWLGVFLWALVLNAQCLKPGEPAADSLTSQAASRTRARHATALGWLFGTTWLCAGTWWLYISLHRYGGLPAWLAAVAVFLLCAALSLYVAATGYVYARWHRPDAPALAMADLSRWQRWRERWRGVTSNAALFAALWVLAEMARALIFTGFPWAASGYAHLHGPLRSLLPWVGIYGVGALAAVTAAWAATVLLRPQATLARRLRPLLALVIGVLLVSKVAEHDFSRPTAALTVSLLQGNVPQDSKFDPASIPEALNWYVQHLFSTAADVAIAPETALPLLPEQLPEGFWDEFTGRIAKGSVAVLTGMPQGSFETGYTNSVIGLAPGRAPGASYYRYDKHHLVPFGEFTPTGFRWFLDLMNMPLGDFNRGPLQAPSFEVRSPAGKLLRLAPMICYEDVFGEELARRFLKPTEAPHIMVNVSNLAWFDDSSAIPQHLRVAQVRAVELQRPMVRATNTGATAIIDHTGALQQALPIRTQGVLSGLVTGREGITPYVWWTSRWGLWPLIVLALAIVTPCIVARTAVRPI